MMMDASDYRNSGCRDFRSSTPKSKITRTHNGNSGGTLARSQRWSHSQAEELQSSLSKLALENEELKYELNQLRLENERLQQVVQEKEMIQAKMRRQLETVTQTAYNLYDRFRAFKCRYYEERRNDIVVGGGQGDDE